jgi:transcriptional regulator with XRE-family HTH domain
MDIRIGARFRALRQRLGWRQRDLAARAHVSQSLVSLLERGHLERLSIESIRRIAHALDADFVVQLRWRGGDLDRLVDEAHAALVGTTAELLRRAGWQLRLEVSYAIYRERGSIDILAWHPRYRALLVVEVKSELTNVEETLRKQDEKVRLAPRIVAEQLGWQVTHVGRLLVLPEQSTARRRVERRSAVMDVAYPSRGAEARRWLAAPAGPTAGLLFVSTQARRGGAGTSARRRIRRSSAAA